MSTNNAVLSMRKRKPDKFPKHRHEFNKAVPGEAQNILTHTIYQKNSAEAKKSALKNA